MSCTTRPALGRVLKSSSKCIFENLAFEEHIFRSQDVAKQGQVVFIWSNKPTVVIGRHQNPWVEINLNFAKEQNVQIVRRHSGGGTVYHDQGNLNVSVLTTHKDHCRPRNLALVATALNSAFKLQVLPNKRDDLELIPGPRKCSGTAARIARGLAYHHFTLLINADLQVLSQTLRSPYKDAIETNATRSVRAPAVGFLAQDDPKATSEAVLATLLDAFRQNYQDCLVEEVDVASEVQIRPEIAKIHDDLLNWQWIYGKTPAFVYNSGTEKVTVRNGLVSDVIPNSPRFVVGQRFQLE